MFDQGFTKRQQSLYELYDFLAVLRWVLAAIAFTATGALTPNDPVSGNSNESLGQLFLYIGIAALIIPVLIRMIIRTRLKDRLWSAYIKTSGDTNVDVSKHFQKASTGPVLTKKSAYSTVLRMVTGKRGGRDICFQEIQVTYQKPSVLSDDESNYSFRYLVLSVELDENVPHIFIDGKSQNKLTAANKNLWSLTKKLDSQQKMQELEGDFSTYFDVYTTTTSKNSTHYQRQIDALRVLTPDAMLALRDDGYEFDYELYKNRLYVIHEPDLITTDEFEAFIEAQEAALKELLPQLTKHNFDIDGSELAVDRPPFDVGELGKLIVTVCKYILVALAFGLIGVLISAI